MNRKRPEMQPLVTLDELRRPSPPEMDLNQPVESAPLPLDIEVARSTTDPLQINFAAADIAGKLHNSRTSSGVKTFALVFIGGPTTIFAIGLIATAWSNPRLDAMRVLFDTALGLVLAAFWPYVIFAHRRKKAKSS